ncbi:MAG: MFS transporter [Dehalococcoidia bacterium]|jgi:MFS family permease|nr:MFS transporter [Dehalococcoidia bacterium]
MRTAGRNLSPNQVLGLVCAGVFFASLDQTVVVTALPAMMLDLEISISRIDEAAWVITGYLLGFTAAVPLSGRAGDIYGHRRVYQVGLLVIAMASIVVAMSSGLGWIVGARVAQAMGGGALVASAIALASNRASASRRALVLGVVGASAEIGSVLGPLYGGAIIELANWRWVFWLNIPQSAFLLVGLAMVREAPRPSIRLDLGGGLLLGAVLALTTFALTQREIFRAASIGPYLILGLGIGLFVALVVVERRVRDPLFNSALFITRPFLAAFSIQLLVGAGLIVALVTVPLMSDTVLGQTPFGGAMRLMRFTGAMPFGAVAGGYLTRYAGPKLPTMVGLVLAAVGFVLMSQWDTSIRDPALSVHLAVGGFGFGLLISPILVAAVNAGGGAYRGTAAALVTVARMLGMTLGLAALSGWGIGYFELLTTDLRLPIPGIELPMGTEALTAAQYQQGVTDASLAVFSRFFIFGAVVSVAALAPALWLGRHDPEAM